MTWRGMWRFLGWGQYPLILAGGAVGIAAEVALFYAAHQTIWSVTTALGFVAAGYIVETILPRRHAHCDVCQRCSLLDSHARRRTSALAVELRDVGWALGDRNLCAGCSTETER